MTSFHSHIGGRIAEAWVYRAWGALIWIVGLGPAAETLASPSRDFRMSTQEMILSAFAGRGGISHWVGLGVVLLVLGVGIMSVLFGLVLRETRLPKAGWGLWIAVMAFALGSLLSAFFGRYPDLSLAILAIPVTFTAVYLLPPIPIGWFVKQTKKVLLFYAYGSLLASLVVPQWAMEYPYDAGVIPGFNVRLHGLVAHANNLAPFFVAYLILSWLPSSRFRWERFHQAMSLVALILTQSKTAWLVLVLAYLIRLAYAAWSLDGLQRYMVLAFAGAAFSSGILYFLAGGPAWLNEAEGLLSSSDLPTLTGRIYLWRVTVDVWEQNPWFGYGPTLWNQQMGILYSPFVGFVPTDAHNQLYQTLGQAGVVGVAGLLLYVLMLLVYGIRYARVTAGVALALVSVMFLRGITEAVMLWGPKFVIHFFIFAFLMLASKQKSVSDQEHSEFRRARSSLP